VVGVRAQRGACRQAVTLETFLRVECGLERQQAAEVAKRLASFSKTTRQAVRQAGTLATFLRQECGLQEQQAAEVVDRFALPEYGVLDTATLFALEDEGLMEILAPLPLGPRSMILKKVKALRD